jgi:hypothetical protein
MKIGEYFRLSFFAAAISCICLTKYSSAATIPPTYIDSVVALGAMQPVLEGGRPVSPARLHWVPEGTGFFYGHLVIDDPDIAKRKYELFLVTAKHVVTGHTMAGLGNIIVRINPTTPASKVKEFEIPNQPKPGEGTWFYHDNQDVDLAIVRINPDFLHSNGIEPKFFASDVNVAGIDKISSLEISAGDGVFVLGFPMGLTGEQRNYVIVREGVIARLNEMKDRVSKTFMIDSFVFPGNSGGPVVSKPELISITGTKNQLSAYLIGVVSAYIPYTDVAISQQTKHARILFEENSGLAEIIPTDYIDEAINSEHTRNIPQPTQAPPLSPTPEQGSK